MCRVTLGFGFVALVVGAAWASAPAPPVSWPPDAFLPVTAERLVALPAAERRAWSAYLEASGVRIRLLPKRSDREGSPAGPIAGPPKGGRHTRGLRRDAPAAWYASEEAHTIADRVVGWQSPAGGWTKGIEYTRPRPPGGEGEDADTWSHGTFDNDATTAELRFLAQMVAANDAQRTRPWREALLRGFDYVLAAQYPNGGFPQIYPLAGGYHDAITYNDSAMVHALEILRDVAGGRGGFEIVPVARREEAERRLALGIGCVLATQIAIPDGRRTAWSQQHDALTLRPCAARNFEPAAASAMESAALVELLMSLPHPSPALVRAIDDAMTWLKGVALRDVSWNREATAGTGLGAAPGAPLLWARLYEVGSDIPVFGDRDRTIHYTVTELSSERRLGYQWYGAWPQSTLDAYERWRAGRRRLDQRAGGGGAWPP
jgi:PelA/Pel-15E family pectate lyase